MADIVNVGNKIELVNLASIIKNSPEKKVYVSKVYDILPKNTLQIAMPIFEGKIVPLNTDEKYSACFYTAKGLMQCNVVVTKRYKSGNLFFLEVLMLSEPAKVQRREFYRYKCMLDAKVRVISDNEYETGLPDDISVPEEQLDWSDVKILDISGGGAKIVAKNHLDRNEIIKISFVVVLGNEVMFFNLIARILSSNGYQGRNDIFEQRLEFMKMEQEDRDKIIRYIFENERMARAKGSRLK